MIYGTQPYGNGIISKRELLFLTQISFLAIRFATVGEDFAELLETVGLQELHCRKMALGTL